MRGVGAALRRFTVRILVFTPGNTIHEFWDGDELPEQDSRSKSAPLIAIKVGRELDRTYWN